VAWLDKRLQRFDPTNVVDSIKKWHEDRDDGGASSTER
jgi:hypothetical protein